MSRFGVIIYSPLLLIAIGCAGPTTPFGSPEDQSSYSSPEKPIRKMASQNKYDPVITILPDKQVLHARSPIEVKIFDPQGVPNSYDFNVYYNGRDLTSRFMSQASVKKTRTTLTYKFNGIRLPPQKRHKIATYYSRGDSLVGHWKKQRPPICGFYQIQKVRTTENFNVKPHVLRTISSVATRHGINEALLAGLIAQESAYNPKAVSYAKALGLTQVTNLASQDIVGEHRDWPVNPLVKKLRPSRVKQYIHRKIINPKNDWRLDTQKSISGGAAYLEYLQNYWTTPENRRVLEATIGVDDKTWAQVLLASYNSGAYRVKRALMKYRSQWLSSPTLNEASKYVPRIMSYCHHFSNPRTIQ